MMLRTLTPAFGDRRDGTTGIQHEKDDGRRRATGKAPHGDDDVVNPFRLERVEQSRGQAAAREPAGMRVVVDDGIRKPMSTSG